VGGGVSFTGLLGGSANAACATFLSV